MRLISQSLPEDIREGCFEKIDMRNEMDKPFIEEHHTMIDKEKRLTS